MVKAAAKFFLVMCSLGVFFAALILGGVFIDDSPYAPGKLARNWYHVQIYASVLIFFSGMAGVIMCERQRSIFSQAGRVMYWGALLIPFPMIFNFTFRPIVSIPPTTIDYAATSAILISVVIAIASLALFSYYDREYRRMENQE